MLVTNSKACLSAAFVIDEEILGTKELQQITEQNRKFWPVIALGLHF
jgi:hypothetical protein